MNEKSLDRAQFLRQLGMGSKALMAFYCLGAVSACSIESPEPDNTGNTDNTSGGNAGLSGTTTGNSINFTVDLTHTNYSKLKTEGEFVYVSNIIIVNAKGTMIALSKVCTHQGTTIEYRKGSNDFRCPDHGSQFTTDGSVTQSPAGKSLTVYSASLSQDGNTLTVKA